MPIFVVTLKTAAQQAQECLIKEVRTPQGSLQCWEFSWLFTSLTYELNSGPTRNRSRQRPVRDLNLGRLDFKLGALQVSENLRPNRRKRTALGLCTNKVTKIYRIQSIRANYIIGRRMAVNRIGCLDCLRSQIQRVLQATKIDALSTQCTIKRFVYQHVPPAHQQLVL